MADSLDGFSIDEVKRRNVSTAGAKDFVDIDNDAF
jgi:hypothetical protein